MKDPLIGPVAAIAAGILVSRLVPFRQFELPLLVAGFLILGLVALIREARTLAGICCLLGLLFSGAWITCLHAPSPAPELNIEGRELALLGGCVVEPPVISGDRARFVLELEPHALVQVTLYSRNDERLPSLAYGQRVEMDARIRVPRNYRNPGAFDYAHYLSRREVFWTASGPADSVHILAGNCGSRFSKMIMDARTAATTRIDRLYASSSYQAAMMQAILLGQQYSLQKVWTEDYRNTGTFHTLVISGTHVAILAAFFLFCLRICFVPESVALALTVLMAWFYALVAGWGAPCVRSAAGLTLFTIARYFYRERRPLNLLAAVALGFLLLDPEQLFDASFQLSFLAVAFLAAFATPLIQATSGPLSRGLADLHDRDRDLHLPARVAQFRIEMRLLVETLRLTLKLPRNLATFAITVPARIVFLLFELTAVSAAIQAGLVLPMIVYFHRVGISGLTANALVVPVMGLVVPVGFIAIFTGWVWVAKAAGWLLTISQAIVHWHASIDPDWRIPTPPLWLGIAFSAGLIFAGVARGRWWRVASGVVVGGLMALLLGEPFAPATHPGELEMTAIDVGQGDSLLIVFPDGKRMLMDGGGIPAYGNQARSQLDIGEDVVAPYLWDRGIRSVDVVALSHAHDDHIGGLPALVKDFHPRELWTGATPESTAWDALRDRARRTGTRIVAYHGPKRFSYGGAEIEILAPGNDYVPAEHPGNNDSLVMRLRYGRHSFLLCGDAERSIERQMLDQNQLEPTDVLKVAHHGSHTSSTEEFLSAVAPVFALISVGYQNSYGHPHADVLERLARARAAVYRTDADGLISIRTDGKRFHVETWNDLATRIGLMPGYE